MSDEKGSDRLEKVEELLKRKKKNGNQICWIKFNPDAEMSYDVVDAEEDIKWMLYEIKRLRSENRELKEFAEALRDQISEELEGNRP